MASADEPYRTWPPHSDPVVDEMFRGANRRDYVIILLPGDTMYTLVSPDGNERYWFPSQIKPSSGVWQVMIYDLRAWLEQTG
jgi:hypothetical protein